jgi:hypothetical protein
LEPLFCVKAKMHHTHLVLDETYVPNTDKEKAVFQEMQIFMYAIMEEHLNMDKGKSLVSNYEVDNYAQSIYRELRKHGTSSTAAWLAGDTLMKYIINARYPGEWRGTSFGFVLHWQEQLAKHFTNMTKCHYRVRQHDVGDMEHALVDHGANGGICGTDMLVLEESERFVNVVGLAGHKVSQLQIVTAQASRGDNCHSPSDGFAW